ncbi:MAG TPA: hypothetical protein VK177_16715, partial [Flavobacteriales bacterium]|nr:hypothetical protein [Flavobacteriales bacterium]
MSLFCEHINKNEKRFNSLIEKYNVPAPRYTSYPTVPYWDNASVTQEEWKELVKDSFLMNNRTDGLSIYIHLPFCESLCTYCGCNTRITVNHKVESPYIRALLTEWAMYIDLFETTPRIRQIHLGGGTPTFFSPANLTALLEGILASAVLTKNAELSFEAHPANTTVEHLKVLYNFG